MNAQRVDPRKPGPLSCLAYDWQLQGVVLFDGTRHRPLGRQLFVAEEPPRTDQPLTIHDAKRRRVSV